MERATGIPRFGAVSAAKGANDFRPRTLAVTAFGCLAHIAPHERKRSAMTDELFTKERVTAIPTNFTLHCLTGPCDCACLWDQSCCVSVALVTEGGKAESTQHRPRQTRIIKINKFPSHEFVKLIPAQLLRLLLRVAR
jgi:hypothetical protein